MIINKQKKEMVSKHNFESVAIKKKQQPFSSSDKKLSKLIKIIFLCYC